MDRGGLCDNLTIDVAETTGLALLGVMESTSPVDCDVAFSSVEARSAFHAATSGDTTELEEAIKDGTIVADVELALLFHEGVHIVWSDLLEKVDILVRMKLGHLMLCSWFGSLYARVSQCGSDNRVQMGRQMLVEVKGRHGPRVAWCRAKGDLHISPSSCTSHSS